MEGEHGVGLCLERETDTKTEYKDLIVLNSLEGVGVGQRGYYVSSDVEWFILVMGHQEGGGEGGWGWSRRKTEGERERLKRRNRGFQLSVSKRNISNQSHFLFPLPHIQLQLSLLGHFIGFYPILHINSLN